MAPDPRLDVITIGRSSVDLYGAQVGGRQDWRASRLSAAPDEHRIAPRGWFKAASSPRRRRAHGPIIREQCAREGVDEGVRRSVSSPRLFCSALRRQDLAHFYRENCADSALDERHRPHYIESAKAVLVAAPISRERPRQPRNEGDADAPPGAKSSSTSITAGPRRPWRGRERTLSGEVTKSLRTSYRNAISSSAPKRR
jgi:hypothetical protein